MGQRSWKTFLYAACENGVGGHSSPNINVEVVTHSQTNTLRTALKLGEGVILKSHPFY